VEGAGLVSGEEYRGEYPVVVNMCDDRIGAVIEVLRHSVREKIQ
jgi:hypothetical protein